MRKLGIFLFLVFWLLLNSSCLTPHASQDRWSDQSLFARSLRVEGVPFIPQKSYECGPASLAMVMAWSGDRSNDREALLASLGRQMMTPSKNGSLQLDLLGTARRQGLLALALHTPKDLLTELAAGHPVIVLENLRFAWWPQWHYAVVIGFDAKADEMILHSGTSAELRVSRAAFLQDWNLAGLWGMVALPAGQLAASQGEAEHVAAAAALERLQLSEKARRSYQAIVSRWPQSLGGLVGQANTAYALGDVDATVLSLEKAVAAHPDAAGAWHNLAFAYAKKNQLKEARNAAQNALFKVGAKEHAAYLASLKSILEQK